VKIRQARVTDLTKIQSLVKQHFFTDPNPKRTSGFFNYMPCEGQFLLYLENNPYCLLAEKPSSRDIEGFIIAGDDKKIEQVARYYPQPVFNRLFQFQRPFLYIDEIAVKKPKLISGARTAKILADREIELASSKIQRLLCVTAFSPWRNLDIEHFLAKYRFKVIEEIQDKDEVILRLHLRT